MSNLLLVFGLWLTGALFCCSGSVGDQPLTPSQRVELQKDKEKACSTVRKLTQAGGFTKIEGGYSGVTHAYVDRGFFDIPVDAKETAMKAVAVCYIDLEKKNQLGLVIIHDGYSGKRIGTFDFASGLRMD